MSQEELKHTPTPWEVWGPASDCPQVSTIGNEKAICSTYGVYTTVEEKQSNAAFIVKACNSYYESQETIRTLEERVKELEQASAEISGRNVSLHLKKLELERKLKTE